MIRKSYYNDGNACRVTFRFEPDSETVSSVNLVSEVDDWDTVARPMTRRKDGSFSTSVTMRPGRYRFRYLVDGQRWVNDHNADDFVDNGHGDVDGVVDV